MPMNPIAERWVTRIYTIWVNEGGSARAIAQKIRAEGGEVSERTVGRYLKMWPDKDKDEQNRYREFRWPESCRSGALPWEAAPAGLEMLRHFEGRSRPLLGAVEWLWRVTQVVPDAPYVWRRWAALDLPGQFAAGEGNVNDAKVRAVETWLIDYLSGNQPDTPPPMTSIPPNVSSEDRTATIEMSQGHDMSPQVKEEIEAEINRAKEDALNDD